MLAFDWLYLIPQVRVVQLPLIPERVLPTMCSRRSFAHFKRPDSEDLPVELVLKYIVYAAEYSTPSSGGQ